MSKSSSSGGGGSSSSSSSSGSGSGSSIGHEGCVWMLDMRGTSIDVPHRQTQ